MVSNQPPRLLEIFCRYRIPGGEETVANRISSLLASKLPFEECRFSSYEWDGPSAPPIWHQPFLMWRNPAALAKIRATHERFQPDVWLVHNLFPVASASVYQLASDLNVPVVHYCHNFRPFSVNGYCWANGKIAAAGLRKNFLPEVLAGSWQGSRLKTAIFAAVLLRLHTSRALESVSTWVAISDFVRDRFIEAGIQPARVQTLRHSWTPQNTARPPLSQDQGHFLFLGRLSEEKGIHVLLEAWRIVMERLGPGSPRLVIAGDGPLRQLVERSTGSHIAYAGLVDGEEKQQLLAGCRAVIVPSVWWEALGLVVYEAFDHSKPVLAAASGGLPESVADGITGHLHPPGNAEPLASQVINLHSNPDSAQRLGSAGRRWLESNTGVEDWTREFLAIIQGAIRPT